MSNFAISIFMPFPRLLMFATTENWSTQEKRGGSLSQLCWSVCSASKTHESRRSGFIWKERRRSPSQPGAMQQKIWLQTPVILRERGREGKSRLNIEAADRKSLGRRRRKWRDRCGEKLKYCALQRTHWFSDRSSSRKRKHTFAWKNGASTRLFSPLL